MIRMQIKVPRELYERAVIVTDFVYNLYRLKIIDEKQMKEIINYFADMHAKEEKDKKRKNKK